MGRQYKSAALILASALSAGAQTFSHKIDLPKDSPVGLLSENFENSNASARGGAYFLDVNASLSFRNSSQMRIRAINLLVYSQEVTAGGKSSVNVQSLNVAPGDTFPIRLNMTLLWPLGSGSTPSVNVKLDGVLFDNLSFYGPDSLHAQNSMTIAELEARRDRKYFKTILESKGSDALQKEITLSLVRQGTRSQPGGGVQVVRGRSTNADPETDLQFAFLELPESPVEAVSGTARIAGNEVRSPVFKLRNRSNKPIQHVDIGWIVKDSRGREFQVGSVPADIKLAANQSGQVTEDASLRFSDRTSVQSMTGFVSSVRYEDGSYWIPSHGAFDDTKLKDAAAPSAEEQRLAQIYNKKGLPGLIEELKKF